MLDRIPDLRTPGFSSKPRNAPHQHCVIIPNTPAHHDTVDFNNHGKCPRLVTTPQLLITTLTDSFLSAYLATNLPPNLLTHLTSHSRTYWTLYQRALSITTAFQIHFLRPLTTLLTPLLTRATQNPDITTILLLGVLLFLSLKALDMFVRSVLFWIRLAVRLAFWGVVVALGGWVWARGLEGVVEDCKVWVEVWRGEYAYWSDGGGGGRVGSGGRGVDAGGVAGAWF